MENELIISGIIICSDTQLNEKVPPCHLECFQINFLPMRIVTVRYSPHDVSVKLCNLVEETFWLQTAAFVRVRGRPMVSGNEEESNIKRGVCFKF